MASHRKRRKKLNRLWDELHPKDPSSTPASHNTLKRRFDTLDSQDPGSTYASHDGSTFVIKLENIPHVRNPKLCSLCSKMTLQHLTKEISIPHQPNFMALDRSAADGCHMCKLLRRAVLYEYQPSQHSRYGRRQWSEERAIEYQAFLDTSAQTTSAFTIERFEPSFTETIADFGVQYRRQDGRRVHPNFVFDANTRNEDVGDRVIFPTLLLTTCDPAHPNVNGRPVVQNANFDLCRHWMQARYKSTVNVVL